MLKAGIFIPIYFREELAKKCLLSLAKTNVGNIKVFLSLGINGASEDFKNNFIPTYIKQYYKNPFISIDVFDFNENLGKPRMIDLMTEKKAFYNYVVSIDSDMESTDDNWLLNFVDIFESYSGSDLGALVANQVGNNVHQMKTFKKYRQKVKQFSLVNTIGNFGIAGGVLITPLSLWRKISGYRVKSIYGGDDYTYCIECEKYKRIVAMVEEIKFFHPFSEKEDIGYIEWKAKVMAGTLSEEEYKGFYEDLRK